MRTPARRLARPDHVILQGDCLARLRELAPESVDAVVCDPPYDLTAVSRNGSPRQNDLATPYGRTRLGGDRGGFMGKSWDGTGVAFDSATWAEVLRVLKPGGHLIAAGGTRTFHRLVCAIEDAGFEVRDTLCHLYGQGFPKSHNVGLSIDKLFGHPDRGHRIATASKVHPDGTPEPPGENLPAYVAKSEEAAPWVGYGTALKPAVEFWTLVRKPLGTGEIDVRRNVEREIKLRGFIGEITWSDNAGCVVSTKRSRVNSRIPSSEETFAASADVPQIPGIVPPMGTSLGARRVDGTPFTVKSTVMQISGEMNRCDAKSSNDTDPTANAAGKQNSLFSPLTISKEAEQSTGEKLTERCMQTLNEEDFPLDIESFAGIATGLSGSVAHVLIRREGNRFAWPEDVPMFVPSKPLNVAANVLRWGTGALNVDGCRIWTDEVIEQSGQVETIRASAIHPGYDRPGRTMYRTDKPIERSGPANKLGRWPANLVLSHSESCELIGTKRVKTSMGTRGSDVGNVMYGKGIGLNRPSTGQTVGFADAEGLETVEAWTCEENCPVRLLDEQAGELKARGNTTPTRRDASNGVTGWGVRAAGPVDPGDAGGPSRFFATFAADRPLRFRYQSKASAKERWTYCLTCAVPVAPAAPADRAAHEGHTTEGHPTQKPLALMRWLVRLVAPRGALIVDPFAGSGTTIVAAKLEGIRAIGMEQHAPYAALASARVLATPTPGPRPIRTPARRKTLPSTL